MDALSPLARRPRVIKAIQSQVTRGCGGGPHGTCPEDHDHEVCRAVYQYHTLDGRFLAEFDSVPEGRRLITKPTGPFGEP